MVQREKLLTMQQVGEILSIEIKTLYQWSWMGKNLPFVKVGGALRVSEQDLYKFILKSKSRKTKNLR